MNRIVMPVVLALSVALALVAGCAPEGARDVTPTEQAGPTATTERPTPTPEDTPASTDGIGAPPDGDPPAGLDWDLYCGPSPLAPYNPNRVGRSPPGAARNLPKRRKASFP